MPNLINFIIRKYRESTHVWEELCKTKENVRVVISGAGAAGIAVSKILLKYGFKIAFNSLSENIVYTSFFDNRDYTLILFISAGYFLCTLANKIVLSGTETQYINKGNSK